MVWLAYFYYFGWDVALFNSGDFTAGVHLEFYDPETVKMSGEEIFLTASLHPTYISIWSKRGRKECNGDNWSI